VKILLFALLVLTATLPAAEVKSLWIACGPEELLKAVEPLAELRRGQGMEAVIFPGSPQEAMQSAKRRVDFLLIVGDDLRAPADPATAKWRVPAARVEFHRWDPQHRPNFASDFALGGLDADGIPYSAVGRLPVRTPEETRQLVSKILAWEKQPATRADLALPMWAGDPMYDPKFTEIFMGFFFAQIGKNAPAWLEPWILCGDPKHPLCGWPAAQARVFNERTAQGGLFIGMMGHGGHDLFCSMPGRAGGGYFGFYNADARTLTDGPVRPPQLIFACSCGEFDYPRGRCLAEELLFAPAGPVLTVAATIESHPLPNFYSATNLLRLLRNADGPIRFGTLWLQTQRTMRRRTDFLMETMLKGVEGNYGAAMDPQQLKQDQATLYAILGDPATRLRTPRKLTVQMEKTPAGWAWNVTPPPGATRLSVEYRQPEPAFPERPAEITEAAARELLAKANAQLAFQSLPAEGWRGQTEKKGVLRFVTETDGEIWVGAAELK
jgi:hypothetical protein